MGDDANQQRRDGEWITHSTLREVYSSWWMTLRIDDVEKPDGSHTEHEVVRGPDAAGMIVLDPARGVLMIWRHRFMPETWGWEVPGGAIDPGEEPETAARRECLEETGWQLTSPSRLLSTHHPSVGLVNQTFHIYLGSSAEDQGPPSDANEAARVEWRSLTDVAADMSQSESIVQAVAEQIGATKVTHDDDIAKISLVGAGMKSSPGIAAKMFRVLADEGVNIQMISTSTIRVSIIIPAGDMERAAIALHTAFGLDSGADYSAPLPDRK